MGFLFLLCFQISWWSKIMTRSSILWARGDHNTSHLCILLWCENEEEESPPRLYLLSFTPIGFLMGLVKYRWKRKRSIQPHTRCRKLERLRDCRSCAWMLQSSMYPGYSLTLLGCAWSGLLFFFWYLWFFLHKVILIGKSLEKSQLCTGSPHHCKLWDYAWCSITHSGVLLPACMALSNVVWWLCRSMGYCVFDD